MKMHCPLILLLSSVVTASAQLEIFVDPSGNDSNTGSISSPFQTVTRARDYLRTQSNLPNGAVVNLRAGEHFFSGTLQLGTQDSGQAGAPIIYTAYNGEKAIISGAGVLDYADFSPVTDNAILNRVIDPTASAALLQINLSGVDLGEINRRGWGVIVGGQSLFPDDPEFELIIGEKRMQLARWPNPEAAPLNLGDPLGSVDLQSVIDAGSTPSSTQLEYTTTGGTFSYNFPTNRPALWSNASDIWLSGTLDRAWEWDYLPVASINSAVNQITLAQGTDSGITTQETFFHFENLLEEIDQKGEYYLDRSTSTLYLYPPDGMATADIRYTNLQTFNMIQINGADHIEIRDLIFENSRRGAIDARGDNLRIQRCEFRNLRGGAMLISGENIAVLDSQFHDIGSRGIIVGKFGADSGIGDKATLTPGNVFIENCEFYKMAYYQANYTPSIQLLSGVSPRISHCYFHDNPHFSIGGKENNGIIEYCEFENTPALLVDVGAVYYNTGRNAEVQGTIIRRNYFHDIGYDVQRGKSAGVYLDNTCRGFTIEENIFQRIGRISSDWTIFNHGGGPGSVKNNIFVDCVNPVSYVYALVNNTYMTIEMFTPNWETVLGAPGQPNALAGTDFLLQYPELETLIPADGNYESRKAAPTSRVSRNLFYNPNSTRLNASDGTDDGIQVINYGADLTGILEMTDNFVASTDPGFTNAAADDLSLSAGASVFNDINGFNDPEFKRNGVLTMGLRGPVGPRTTTTVPAEPALKWETGAFFTANGQIDSSYGESVSSLASDSTTGATLTFEKVSGPDWLTVSSTGQLSGSPTASDRGLNQFAVRVISSTGEEDESILRITVTANSLAFLTDVVSELEAVAGRDYFASLPLEVNNPDWSNLLTFSGLTGPAWLTLSSEGKLTGRPTAADLGTNTWSVVVTDTLGNTDSASLTVDVLAAPSSLLHVDAASGNDSNDGSTWALAKATIQGAYNAAVTDSEIWVAEGTYTGTLSPPSRVSIYGGFSVGDSFADRNPDDHPVIHSPGFFNIVGKNDILLDGLTFTGQPDGFNNPIKIDTNTGSADTDNIVLVQCKVTGNNARGAVLVRGWRGQRVHNVSFIDCEISQNSATGDFAGNIGLIGIYGEASWERCLIHSNSVGAAMTGGGSGAMDFAGVNALRVENSIFYSNTTAVANNATGILVRGGRKVQIRQNTFDGVDDATGNGDGLVRHSSGSGLVLTNNLFFNSARSAVYSTNTSGIILSGNVFSENTSGVTGTDNADTETALNALAWASGNTVTTDPFIDAPLHDYRLTPGSAAIDAGVNISSIIADFQGIARDLSPDPGAFEYNATLQDSDGDFMVDSWETQYGLALLDPSDATLDSDGDGVINVNEFIAGSAPNSSSSIWKSTVTRGINPNEQDITFETQAGRQYLVQRSYTLQTPDWTTLQTISGDGTEHILTVPETPDKTEAFYRVAVSFE